MTGKVIPLRPVRGGTEEISDSAIVAACAAKDTAALGVLFDRFHRDVWRFLSRLLGTGCPEIDDLTQATFLEAWRSAGRFKERSTVKSWLLGIANNLARRYFRGQSRKRAALAGMAELVTPARPLFEATHDRIMIDRLARALAELPHDLKAAFVLCDLEGVRGVDAARALGVRPGTMWRRLHDARKKLRTELEREEER